MAKPVDTSVIWGVPHERNEHFVGRGDLLAELHLRLLGGDRVQVLHGLGGIGKTQTAVEYAHRHAADYSLVWWVPALSDVTILTAYEALATRLGHRLSAKVAPAVAVELLAEMLADHRPLLIYDGAPDAAALRPLLPAVPAAHVLITSRNPNWAGVAHTRPMRVLARDESVAFLHRRTGLGDDGSGDDAKVAHNLGDLPLALEQAGAVIRQAGLSYAGYLRRFETQWATLLGEGLRPVDYPRSVAMTWGLAFAELEAAAPAAGDLLKLAAFLNADRVPLAMLRDAAAVLPPAVAAVTADPRLWAAAHEALSDYAVADADEAGFGLHRLVAMVVRDRMGDAAAAAWCGVAVRLLARLFKFNSADVATWGPCGQLLPHLIEATTHAERLGVEPGPVTELLNDAGRYLLKRGQYADARDLLERALALLSQSVKETDPKLSGIANNLGRAHDRLGNADLALHYFGRVIDIDTAFYGQSHPHVAEVVNNYAICVQKKGDAESARQHFAWAAQIYEANFGPQHPKLAQMLNNLGYTLQRLDDAAGARLQLSRALEIAEATVGRHHPTTARILFNLADVHRRDGELSAARAMLERAADIDQSVLGPAHPDVRADFEALAAVLDDLGEPAAATDLRHRAAAIRSNRRPRAPAATAAVEVGS